MLGAAFLCVFALGAVLGALAASAVVGFFLGSSPGAGSRTYDLGAIDRMADELDAERSRRVQWQRRALRRGWRPGQCRGNR